MPAQEQSTHHPDHDPLREARCEVEELRRCHAANPVQFFRILGERVTALCAESPDLAAVYAKPQCDLVNHHLIEDQVAGVQAFADFGLLLRRLGDRENSLFDYAIPYLKRAESLGRELAKGDDRQVVGPIVSKVALALAECQIGLDSLEDAERLTHHALSLSRSLCGEFSEGVHRARILLLEIAVQRAVPASELRQWAREASDPLRSAECVDRDVRGALLTTIGTHLYRAGLVEESFGPLLYALQFVHEPLQRSHILLMICDVHVGAADSEAALEMLTEFDRIWELKPAPGYLLRAAASIQAQIARRQGLSDEYLQHLENACATLPEEILGFEAAVCLHANRCRLNFARIENLTSSEYFGIDENKMAILEQVEHDLERCEELLAKGSPRPLRAVEVLLLRAEFGRLNDDFPEQELSIHKAVAVLEGVVDDLHPLNAVPFGLYSRALLHYSDRSCHTGDKRVELLTDAHDFAVRALEILDHNGECPQNVLPTVELLCEIKTALGRRRCLAELIDRRTTLRWRLGRE